MDSIAKTSLLTAAMRAAESKRSESDGRLFFDPYAELLAGEEGLSLMQRGIAEAGDQPAIAVRTHYMDTKITEALQNGVRQIVILAAGMDTRAYRLNFPERTKIFELDRKEVFDYKNAKLKGIIPNCDYKCLGVDLREDWPSELVRAGFQAGERTLWLVEGLLMYLDEDQVLMLMTRISKIASSKDTMLFDVLTRTLLEAPYMQKQLKFLESIGAPWKFGINEPEEFLMRFGWNSIATQPGEFAPGRWPFPVTPRSVPNVPRSFFIEAHKT